MTWKHREHKAPSQIDRQGTPVPGQHWVPGLLGALALLTVSSLLTLTLATPRAEAQSGDDSPKVARSAQDPQPAPPQTGGPATGDLHWHASLAPAREAAAKADELLFVDLFAEWCGWCYVLADEVFTTPEFAELAEGFELVRLDVEDQGEGRQTQSRFDATALPTTLILEPSGALVGRVEGMAGPDEYIANIERQIQIHRRVVELFDAVVAGDVEPEAERMRALAKAFHERDDGARAVTLYRKLEELGWTDPEGPGHLTYRLAAAQLLIDDVEGAAASVNAARERALQGDASEELMEAIDLLEVRVAAESGDCEHRRRAMESFLERYPTSNHHRQVESQLVAMETGVDGSDCG